MIVRQKTWSMLKNYVKSKRCWRRLCRLFLDRASIDIHDPHTHTRFLHLFILPFQVMFEELKATIVFVITIFFLTMSSLFNHGALGSSSNLITYKAPLWYCMVHPLCIFSKNICIDKFWLNWVTTWCTIICPACGVLRMHSVSGYD